MNKVAACTIAAKSELAMARVIADSWNEHHPEIPCFVLLADEVDGYFDPEKEPFTLIGLDELEPADVIAGMVDRYGRNELSCALTPWVMSHLLERGFEKVLFFKQESLITGEHTPAIDLLDEHPIVLTPHITEPKEGPAAVDWELTILMAGVYNGGFVGVAQSEQATAMLAWWQRRLADWCRLDTSLGLHWEQGWLSLAPMLFPDTHVLRDPAASVGHWNLPERADVDTRLLRPSGYDFKDRRGISKYNELRVSDVGPAGDLYKDYRKRLLSADHRKVRKWPWAFEEPPAFPTDTAPEIAEESLGRNGDEKHEFWEEATIEPVEGGLAICTIFGKNHLALARVFFSSVAEHHPEIPFFAVLSDHPEGYFDPTDEAFPIIGLQTVGYGDQWLNQDEGHKGLAPQLKPYVISRLLEAGYDSVLFIDADMLLTAPIPDVLERVSQHSVTLSPHILHPLVGPLDQERELVIIRAGAYNGGLLGVSAGEETARFLDWWRDRMHGRCMMDGFRGLHHDQRWMALIPSLVADTYLLTDPGINLGHWNLPERVGIEPRLLHFSGYRSDLGDQVTYYDERIKRSEIGDLAIWWARYDKLLADAGFEESRNWPYAFGPSAFHPAGVIETVPPPAP